MLREMADLGFEYVELSHGISILLVPGILQALEEGVVKVSSTWVKPRSAISRSMA